MPLNELNEIIRGRRGVTADVTLRVINLLKTDAELGMGQQAQSDL